VCVYFISFVLFVASCSFIRYCDCSCCLFYIYIYICVRVCMQNVYGGIVGTACIRIRKIFGFYGVVKPSRMWVLCVC